VADLDVDGVLAGLGASEHHVAATTGAGGLVVIRATG
jgi:hypothetical protein